jgi:hypothetical protein
MNMKKLNVGKINGNLPVAFFHDLQLAGKFFFCRAKTGRRF